MCDSRYMRKHFCSLILHFRCALTWAWVSNKQQLHLSEFSFLQFFSFAWNSSRGWPCAAESTSSFQWSILMFCVQMSMQWCKFQIEECLNYLFLSLELNCTLVHVLQWNWKITRLRSDSLDIVADSAPFISWLRSVLQRWREPIANSICFEI